METKVHLIINENAFTKPKPKWMSKPSLKAKSWAKFKDPTIITNKTVIARLIPCSLDVKLTAKIKDNQPLNAQIKLTS